MFNDRQLVEKTIDILDGVNWEAYGDHQASDYLTYIRGQHGDESSLMDGLLSDFLEQVLGFTLHQDLLPQMTAPTTGKRPDYIPDDTHLHPFVFDAKGSDTTDLGEHYDQIADYVRSRGLRYGVLANMRDLAVYTLQSEHPEADYSFSFHELYRCYQHDLETALEAENTQRFLAFARRFQRRELDRAGKVQAIIDARHGPRDAALDLGDLVRRLHVIVAALHDDVRQQRSLPPKMLYYRSERQERIAREIDAIAREIDSQTPERKIKAATLKALLESDPDTTDGQAADRYFYRVAYFAMTRTLLARVWEDIGFIRQILYDGGFEYWYEALNKEIRMVLKQAFFFAGDRYSWLYGLESNYSWYTPSEDVLIDVLYELSRFDFHRLDADVLGAVYETYLDETDRKNKGQYYTPRPMVQFIWDLVGFDAPDQIFSFEGGQRQPRTLVDFCTGSGGFLVEAARRIRETVLGTDFDPDDPESLEAISLDDLMLAMRAIVEGVRGCEINAFAYYLTEVNLLIQLTPIIAAIHEKAPHALNFGQDWSLSVIQQDALKLHNRLQPTLVSNNDDGNNHVSEFARLDEVYEQDRKHDAVALPGYKKFVYAKMKVARDADYVCSNPPYVGEKGHKELFRHYREEFEYWDQYYQGKMDYLYWFVILGLSKLREGGRLGYITTSYWPTADGASTLRQYILDHAKIVEMIDFGETRIFSDAPGQHNMVFVLERCADAEERAAHRPLLVEVKREFAGETIWERVSRLVDHISAYIDVPLDQEFKDEYISVFYSPITQGEMTEEAWAIAYSKTAGAVLHLMEETGIDLSHVLEINAGVHSNADAVKSVDLSRLRPDQQRRVRNGEGIFVLTQGEKERLRLSPEEQDIAKPTYKNSDIAPYVVDSEASLFILYVDNDFEPEQYPTVMRHLERFKPILKSRLERYGENYPWYRLHRPHQRHHYESEKLVAPRWGKRIEFAYESGGCYENSDINLFIKRDDANEDIKYLLALLNSKPLEFWREHKGQFKGVSRQALLKSMPIRPIRFEPPTDEATKQVALDALCSHLVEEDYEDAYEALHQALDAGQEDVVHDGLVELVDQIIDLKTKLADYNLCFNARLTRLEESEPLPEIEPLAVLKELPAGEQWSVDIHVQNGTLDVTENLSGERDGFYFYRVKDSTADAITLRARGRGADTLTLSGDPALIDYLKAILPSQQEQFWREVKGTLAPRDVALYRREVERIMRVVSEIRRRIAERQAVIDRVVLDLYGITDEEDRKLVLGRSEAG